MQKIRTVIVDDEVLARRGIRAQLQQRSDFEIVSECRNGLEAVDAIQREAPDLVFLDVQMPGLDGFGVLEAIDVERIPAIIFVTAYDRYALRAFEVNALDYLLKPIDAERFAKTLERARLQIERNDTRNLNRRLLNLLDDIKSGQRYPERLVIKGGGRIVFLSVNEIDWIEAADNYVRLHAGRESHLMRETLSHLEKRLDPIQFARVHRSAIINLQRIKELHPLFRGEYEIVLKNGTRISSGRNYRERLQELLEKAS